MLAKGRDRGYSWWSSAVFNGRMLCRQLFYNILPERIQVCMIHNENTSNSAAFPASSANEMPHIMLDTMPVSCGCWDEHFNNLGCNHKMLSLLKLPNKATYLERWHDLNPQYQPNGGVSKDLAREYVKKAFAHEMLKFEWLHQDLEGEPVPCEITLVKADSSRGAVIIGCVQDLRELDAAYENGYEAYGRMRAMLDATPLGANFWDKNFKNIDCNQKAVNLFGLKNKQEYLNRFHELSPTYQPCGRLSSILAVEKLKEAFTKGYCRFEWMHQKPNGEPVPTEITLVRARYKNDYIVAGYIRDLREFQSIFTAMGKMEDELRLTRHAAAKNARVKSDFLANISHEIRTPMNGIIGMLHLLGNTKLSLKQKDYLAKTSQSAQALLRVLNNIIDFSAVETGALDMEFHPFSLTDIVNELKEAFAEQIEAKNLNVVMETSPRIPATLTGDVLRVRQIIFNVMDNAVKFTPSGGRIEVYVELLNKTDQYCYLQFYVRDNGIGMTPEQVNNLFTPFNQADASFTRTHGGMGLGMALARSFIGMMHGEIWATSVMGEGSCFNFTARFNLPDIRQEDTAGGSADSCDFTTLRNSGLKAHILLAEDNEINQIIAKELLEDMGHTVDIAHNGSEAISMVQTGVYDLVLMDIQMPVMDGLSACRRIRADYALRNLPIIAMSAHALAADHEKSLASGMNDHLSKPIDPELLFESLQKWLK